MAANSGTAVLVSGGLDSAVLLAEEATLARVRPIYMRSGLAWEDAELSVVRRLLKTSCYANLDSLKILAADLGDIYPEHHWAIRGRPPGYDTPDEAVYLPGRNVVLLSKAAVYCAQERIGRLVLGTLAHNPFPDATATFREALASALSLGLAYSLHIDAPYATLGKIDVIRRGAALEVPFELTLSCMNPSNGRHCERCSKCRERRVAFRQAGVADHASFAAARHEGDDEPRV